MTNAYLTHHEPAARIHLSVGARERVAGVVAFVGIVLLLPGATLVMWALR